MALLIVHGLAVRNRARSDGCDAEDTIVQYCHPCPPVLDFTLFVLLANERLEALEPLPKFGCKSVGTVVEQDFLLTGAELSYFACNQLTIFLT